MIQRPVLVVAVLALVISACGTTTDTEADDDAGPETPTESSVEVESGTTDTTGTEQSMEATVTTANDDEPETTDEPDTEQATTTSPSTTGSGESRSSESTEGSTAPTTGSSGDPTGGGGSIDEGLRPFIDKAVADLAATESVAEADITVESAQIVQWSDASAGCPQPGMQYAQVITDGSAIHLTVDGTSHWYHTGGGSSTEPVRCTSPLRQPPTRA